ncbi:cytochrome P450 [Rhizopus azygosporus]|uniref:Cytochrome P450 n=1 Tax=Rhizopus azygosporus TaxID=86630 RepID=A0A367JWN4_RHIAZ|nr:cytochrome P450 [Rhizopus azygosporus]
MKTITSYFISMFISYIITKVGQKLFWNNKKPDGTIKKPWPPSPKGLPYFINAYYQFQEEAYRALTRWSNQLGELFSVEIGFKRIIVLNSPELVRKLMLEKDQYNSCRVPSDTFENTVTDRGKTIFSAPFSTYWARLRRAVHLVIGIGHYSQFEPVLNSQSETLSACIKGSLNEEKKLTGKELRRLVDLVAADLALTMVVGPEKRDPDLMLDLVERCRKLEALQTSKYNRIGQFFPVFNALYDLFKLITMDNSVTKTRDDLLQVFIPWFDTIYTQREAIEQAKKEKNEPFSRVPTIGKSLLNIDPSKNDPEPVQLTKEEIFINISHITVHAQTYLASTLFTVIQRLATEPEWQEKILEASGEEQVGMAKAFVYESLRLDAPNKLLAYAPRTDYEFEASDGHTYRIDTDAQLVVNVDAIHHNSKYYPNPEKFDPQRFLKSEKKMVSLLQEDQTGKKIANDHMAFGAGRRACLGRKVSEEFLVTALIHLIQTYKLEGGNVDNKIEIGTNIWSWTGRTETEGASIKFVKRQ